jgi:methionine synthase II (cobalamin-independent)
MSGAIMKQGRKLLHSKKCSVLQSHTYAGSSTRALLAATAVLEEFVHHLPSVAQLGQEMNSIMSAIGQNSEGLFICHGQGLMWGGVITYEGQCREEEYRNRVVQSFKKHCEDLCIIPYFVPVGGFMVSPVIDIDVGTVHEIGERLEEAVKRVVDEVAWVQPDASANATTSHTINTKPFLAPPIASASTINLVELALHEESNNSIIKEMDLAYDKVVPHFHDANQ